MTILRAKGAIAVLACCTLAACSTSQFDGPAPQPRAHYSVFTDSTWEPEASIRAPFGAAEIERPVTEALQEGIHAFDGDNESIFRIEPADNSSFQVSEICAKTGEKALSWGTGASVLYRHGSPVAEWGDSRATLMADGRLLVQVRGKADVNYAVKMTAFNVSGKPIRQILRDANNQPDTSAWYVRENQVFPSGSVAYVFTYWLGDDEIIRPSDAAFTGASTLEKLIQNFSKKQPYCLSYIDHTLANPYGVSFEKPVPPIKRRLLLARKKFQRSAQPQEGKFFLHNADHDALFCQISPDEPAVSGRWTIRRVHGTRVLELERPDGVQSSDFGIQPVNQKSIGIGFAEILSSGTSKHAVKKVVPVRILKNNEPITDFRIRFNPTAAAAVREAVADALTSQKAEEQKTTEGTTLNGR